MSVATQSSSEELLSRFDRTRFGLRLPLMLLGVVVVAAVASYYWLSGQGKASTDNAYMSAARSSISANVSGEVAQVYVHDNQHVKRGDLLFSLDDKPYQIAVDEAQARLAAARLQIQSQEATYRQYVAATGAAQSTFDLQSKAFARAQKLLTSGIASQAQYDQAQSGLEAARQQLAVARQQADAALATLGGSADLDMDQHPTVMQAKAELARAELNLSYTKIVAPDDGIVAKVEQLQVGDHITAGSPAFALMSSRDTWVEANFKEDQLTHMRPGQNAVVTFDTYPGRKFKARVVSVAPGTGAEFSALPAENATGNWIKVVQRVPVRLEIEDPDPALPLAAGLSAVVTVETGAYDSATGARAAQ